MRICINPRFFGDFLVRSEKKMTRQELLNQRLKQYIEAEEMILSGQSYQIGDRRLTRANLSDVRKMIDILLSQGAMLDDSKKSTISHVKRVIFDDI